MYVSEVKDELKKYNVEELQSLVIELYKSAPKTLKDEKNWDQLIRDFSTYKNKGSKKAEESIDFKKLKNEIFSFLDNGYSQYYFKPNKSERSKWRFNLKNIVKDLQKFKPSTPQGLEATYLLIEIYKLLLYGSGYYVFSTVTPFRSIGIPQEDFFEMIVLRMLAEGISEETVKPLIKLVVHSILDEDTSNISNVLIKHIKTVDSKELIFRYCDDIIIEMNKSPFTKIRKHIEDTSNQYEYEMKINLAVLLGFKMKILLCEYQDAINFFEEHYKCYDKENKLYELLCLLNKENLKEHWIKVYEKAVKSKIKPREVLQDMYKKLTN